MPAVPSILGNALHRNLPYGIEIACSDQVHKPAIPIGVEVANANMCSAMFSKSLASANHAVLARRSLLR